MKTLCGFTLAAWLLVMGIWLCGGNGRVRGGMAFGWMTKASGDALQWWTDRQGKATTGSTSMREEEDVVYEKEPRIFEGSIRGNAASNTRERKLEDELTPMVAFEIDPTEQLLQAVHQVPCGDTLQSFNTTVFSNLQVNRETLTEAEKVILEELFMKAFNDLAFLGCDAKFRTGKLFLAVP